MNKQLTIIKQETDKRVSSVNLIKVRTNADLIKAKDTLKLLTQVEKNIKEQEQAISKPMREALKANRAFFSPLMDKVQYAKDLLKGKMLTYSNKVEAKKEEREAEMTKKVEDGELSIAQASKKLAKIEEKVSAVPVRIVRKIEITNERNVPQKYWALDMVAIRKDALDGIEIPGVKVVEEKTIVAR